MRNPLRKRYLKEFIGDLGKYLVIFLFVVFLIGSISGFYVSDDSVFTVYNEGFDKYNIESGHFATAVELDQGLIDEFEKQTFTYEDHSYQAKVYKNYYIEQATVIGDSDTKLRVYENRTAVDKLALFDGHLAETKDEISLDRMYASNNGIEVGDTIKVGKTDYKVSGLVAAVDYSCLYEKNSDMMFDAFHFGVAFVSKEGFARLPEEKVNFNYSYAFQERILDDKEANDISEQVLVYLKAKAMLTDFLPEHENLAINFTGEDMGSDKVMFSIFYVFVLIIIAFIFAITSIGTIEKEAGVIGTLRASGYTKGEIIRHYLFLPVLVTLLAAVIGNILGYTLFEDYFKGIYYDNYSLAPYEGAFNVSSFVMTTLVPIVLMLVINLFVLNYKLKLSPLRFLRHDLSRKQRKKAIPLNKKRPFMMRFGLRVLFQNIGNYIVLIIGVCLSALVVVFGLMFGPLLDGYSEDISQSSICDYQYVLNAPVTTSHREAEPYAISVLNSKKEGYKEDEITIFGVQENSDYIDLDFSNHQMYFSVGIMEKYGYKKDELMTLSEKYGDNSYDFVCAGEYDYPAAMAVFMSIDDFNKLFDKEEGYYNGFFTNQKLGDIDERYVVSIITEQDLRKIANQLENSMGEFMALFQGIGVIMFLLMMYLLSKQIVEKNAKSISMIKILGYKNGEVGRLYIISTAIVVVLSLLVSIPICEGILYWCFHSYMYTVIAGYIPYHIDPMIYIKMFIMGIVSFALVSALLLWKISKISKSDALKNVE